MALWLMLTITCTLTVAQVFCGFVANSLSLVGDGALMAVDGVCYAVGLYSESQKVDAHQAEIADRRGALFSSVMLAVTTCWVLIDVVDRLVGDDSNEAAGGGEPAQVNTDIMIGFTAVNLIADVLVVLACWQFGALSILDGGSTSDKGHGQALENSPGAQEANACDETNRSWDPMAKADGNMNIFGAFAHLAADGVRGVAVLICGLLAASGAVDPITADAYCSLFVCVFVLAATVSLLRAVLHKSVSVAYEVMDEQFDSATAGGSCTNRSAPLGRTNSPEHRSGNESCALRPDMIGVSAWSKKTSGTTVAVQESLDGDDCI